MTASDDDGIDCRFVSGEALFSVDDGADEDLPSADCEVR